MPNRIGDAHLASQMLASSFLLPDSRTAAPLDMLSALFRAHGWPFEPVSEDEFAGRIEGAWSSYDIRAVWRVQDKVLQLLVLPDIHVPEHAHARAAELVILANEQMWLGHFDLWGRPGMVVHRHAILLGRDGLLGLDQAQRVVESAVEECNRFYPAFQFLVWGGKNAHEALACAMPETQGEA